MSFPQDEVRMNSHSEPEIRMNAYACCGVWAPCNNSDTREGRMVAAPLSGAKGRPKNGETPQIDVG